MLEDNNKLSQNELNYSLNAVFLVRLQLYYNVLSCTKKLVLNFYAKMNN